MTLSPMFFLTHSSCQNLCFRHKFCDLRKFRSSTGPTRVKLTLYTSNGWKRPSGDVFSWALGSLGKRGQEGLSRGSERRPSDPKGQGERMATCPLPLVPFPAHSA